MDAPLHAFRVALCAEHLEEAAALHDVAVALRADTGARWTDAGAFEQRVERHIDGLVLGGSAADEVCAAALAACDDPGAVIAATAVPAIRGDAVGVRATASLLHGAAAQAAPACARAVALAWVRYLPTALEPELLRVLDADPLAAPAWEAVAARRCDTGGRLARVLATATQPSAPVTEAVAAARWLAAMHCPDTLDPDIAHRDYAASAPAVRTEALRCGLRRRGRQALQRVDDAAAGGSAAPQHAVVAPVIIACAAGAASPHALIERLARDPDAALLHALGVCGSLAAVRPLLECLAQPALAQPAAWALHVLTGLEPMEDARLEDVVDSDELFEGERERFTRDGSAPKAADGLPYAQHIRRLTHDAQAWRQVLHESAQNFTAGVRYRFGQPYSLRALLDGLLRPDVPRALRDAFIDEAQFRHGVDLRFDAESLVRVQRKRLESPRLEAIARADRALPGRWCRDARMLD